MIIKKSHIVSMISHLKRLQNLASKFRQYSIFFNDGKTIGYYKVDTSKAIIEKSFFYRELRLFLVFLKFHYAFFTKCTETPDPSTRIAFEALITVNVDSSHREGYLV